jgi:hypothetical protein
VGKGPELTRRLPLPARSIRRCEKTSIPCVGTVAQMSKEAKRP